MDALESYHTGHKSPDDAQINPPNRVREMFVDGGIMFTLDDHSHCADSAIEDDGSVSIYFNSTGEALTSRKDLRNPMLRRKKSVE